MVSRYKALYKIFLLFMMFAFELYAQDIKYSEYDEITKKCTNIDIFIKNAEFRTKLINKKSNFFTIKENNNKELNSFKLNSYVITGDEVMIGEVYNEYICVAYKVKEKKFHYITGWIEKSVIDDKYLMSSKLDHYSVGFWIHKNEYFHSNIYIEEKNGGLWIYGESSFDINNEHNLRNYVIEGMLTYDKGIYIISYDDKKRRCEYVMRRYADFLLVADYGLCLPAPEFSLSGIYYRN